MPLQIFVKVVFGSEPSNNWKCYKQHSSNYSSFYEKNCGTWFVKSSIGMLDETFPNYLTMTNFLQVLFTQKLVIQKTLFTTERYLRD